MMKDLADEEPEELDSLFQERKDAGSKYTQEQWEANRQAKVELYKDWRVDNANVEDPLLSFEIQHKDDPNSNVYVTKATVTRNKAEKSIEYVSEEPVPDDVTILLMLENARETAKRTGKWEMKISDCEEAPEIAHKIELLALKMKLKPSFDEDSQAALDQYREDNDIKPPVRPDDHRGPNNNLNIRGRDR